MCRMILNHSTFGECSSAQELDGLDENRHAHTRLPAWPTGDCLRLGALFSGHWEVAKVPPGLALSIECVAPHKTLCLEP